MILNWHLPIDTRSIPWLILSWHSINKFLINSWLIVSQFLTDSQLRCRWSVNQVSWSVDRVWLPIKVQSKVSMMPWLRRLLEHNVPQFHLIFEFMIHQIFLPACDSSKPVTWQSIPQLKLRNLHEYSPLFKTVHAAKKIWRIINTIPPLGVKICSNICPWTLSVPKSSQFPRATLLQNCSLLRTDNVRRQIS